MIFYKIIDKMKKHIQLGIKYWRVKKLSVYKLSDGSLNDNVNGQNISFV